MTTDKHTIQPTTGPVLILYPALAAEIGVNHALVLLQIDYLTTTQPNGTTPDGTTWIKYSREDLRTRYFTWLSGPGLGKILAQLEAAGLVQTRLDNPDTPFSVRWYALAPAGIATLKSAELDHNRKLSYRQSVTELPIQPVDTINIYKEIKRDSSCQDLTQEQNAPPTPEPIRETDQPEPKPDTELPDRFWSKIREAWNERVAAAWQRDDRRIHLITEKRKRHIRARMAESGREATTLDWWTQLFDLIAAQDGLRQAGLKGHYTGWGTFDWIIKNSDNFTKVIEGKYRRAFQDTTDRPALPAGVLAEIHAGAHPEAIPDPTYCPVCDMLGRLDAPPADCPICRGTGRKPATEPTATNSKASATSAPSSDA